MPSILIDQVPLTEQIFVHAWADTAGFYSECEKWLVPNWKRENFKTSCQNKYPFKGIALCYTIGWLPDSLIDWSIVWAIDWLIYQSIEMIQKIQENLHQFSEYHPWFIFLISSLSTGSDMSKSTVVWASLAHICMKRRVFNEFRVHAAKFILVFNITWLFKIFSCDWDVHLKFYRKCQNKIYCLFQAK